MVVVNNILNRTDNTAVDAFKKYVIDERFSQQMDKIVCEATVSKIKHNLTIAEISNENELEARKSLTDLINEIDFDKERTEVCAEYEKALNTRNYNKILALFNSKQLSSCIGRFFGLKDGEYIELILRTLESDNENEVIGSLINYLPLDIPSSVLDGIRNQKLER